MNLIPIVAQQDTTPTPTDAQQPMPWWANPFVPILLIIVIFYVVLFRSKRTTEKKRQDMLSQLKRGDRVQTIGGILASVVDVRDNEVLLKVDESSNTKIKFLRSAIHRVLEEEKASSK